MKANRGDVVIGIKVLGDTGNPGALRGIGAKVKKAQEEVTRVSTEQAQKAAEQREKIETASLIRLERASKRRADLAIQQEKRVHDESSKYWNARIRREQQAERDMVRRGTLMARQIDREIKLREQGERRLATARQRSAQRRSDNASIGTTEMAYGGIQAGRGLAELGLAHAVANSEADQRQINNLMQGIVAIQGASDVASGGLRFGGGLMRAAPGLRRGATRMGSRLLQLGGTVAGSLGVSRGLGAVGGSTLAAAGSVAAAGVGAVVGGGLGLNSAYGFGRDVATYGFGKGSKPGSQNAVVGNMLAGLYGWGGEAAGYDPLGNNALKRAETGQRRRMNAVAAREQNRRENEALGGIGAQFDEQVNSIGLSAAIESNQRKYQGAGARARADLGSVRGQIGSLTTQKIGASTDAERVSIEQQVLALMSRQEALLRTMATIEGQTASKRLSSYKAGLSTRDAAKNDALSTVRSFGEAGAADQARIKNTLDRYKSTGTIVGMSPEDIQIVKRFGGQTALTRINAESEEIGKKAGIGAAKDLDRERAGQRASYRTIMRNSKYFDMVTPVGKQRKTDGGGSFTANINTSINVERGLSEAADRVKREIMEEIARLKVQMKAIAEKDMDNAAKAGSQSASG